MPRSSQRRTPEETRALYVALQEARSRGLPVNPKILSGKQTRWPVDSNGYLVKNDGKQYNPTEAQAKFIASQSYFSSFHGSRGCLSPHTLISGIPVADIKSDFNIDTLYGETIALSPLLIGKDYLYKVTTQNHREVVVTKFHQFLTPVGWIPLNRLSVGDLIFSDGTWYGENYSGKSLCSLDYYSSYFHLYDELHSLFELVSLDILQQLRKKIGRAHV